MAMVEAISTIAIIDIIIINIQKIQDMDSIAHTEMDNKITIIIEAIDMETKTDAMKVIDMMVRDIVAIIMVIDMDIITTVIGMAIDMVTIIEDTITTTTVTTIATIDRIIITTDINTVPFAV
jgi:hypothetical protein